MNIHEEERGGYSGCRQMDFRPSWFQILIIESLLGLMPDPSIFNG
jgi:hypothetical protein